MSNKFKAFFMTTTILISSFSDNQVQARKVDRCGRFSGKAYIMCKESGGRRDNYRPCRVHNAKRGTAAGPFGATVATRKRFGGCEEEAFEGPNGYLCKHAGGRYKCSWQVAARWHKNHGTW